MGRTNVENDEIIAHVLQEELSKLADAAAPGTSNADEGNHNASVFSQDWWLRQMVPVPHKPKINGEIPSTDVETSDHQRLQDRLQLYDLVETEIQGDGNCQFRALSHQLYGSQEHHKSVREQVVEQIQSHPDYYEEYVPMAIDEYLRKMSEAEEWGDHVTLQAAADFYGIKIIVMTSFKKSCYFEILPKIEKSKRA